MDPAARVHRINGMEIRPIESTTGLSWRFILALRVVPYEGCFRVLIMSVSLGISQMLAISPRSHTQIAVGWL
jgi:hypothetical protein